MLEVGSVAATYIVWPADAVATAAVLIARPAAAAAEGEVGVAVRVIPLPFLNSAAPADSVQKYSPLISHLLLKQLLFVAGSPVAGALIAEAMTAEATIVEAIAAQRFSGRFPVELSYQFVGNSVLLQ